jgi:hypothetical protein
MPKRTRLAVLALLGAAALLLLSPTPRARAGDPPAAPAGVWVHDVRVVRVDLTHPETAEQAGPFPELGQGTTITLPWNVVLARLKERGRTTLLLDQRVTAMPAVKSTAQEERNVQVVQEVQEDQHVTTWRAQNVKTGVRFTQTSTAESMAYELEVKDVVAPPVDKTSPTETVVSWNGTHPPLRGTTLVLHHRRQVMALRDAAPCGVELYGFVTGRFVPSR